MLNDDFEYCKKKLKSCADHVVRTDQDNDERMRRMSSEQNYRIAQMSGKDAASRKRSPSHSPIRRMRMNACICI